MKLSNQLLRQISSDLGLDVPFTKGQTIAIKNCWHFSTDGNSVEAMFYDAEDFRFGMNQVYIISRKYHIVILAFSLMDTHIHFVLYGDYDECNSFIHEFIRICSMTISRKHHKKKALSGIRTSYQEIRDNLYLKSCICYVIKNAPVGGIGFNAMDYPWSSGPLYFRFGGTWASPIWTAANGKPVCELGRRERERTLKSETVPANNALIIDGIVFPGEYVAYEIVERIFKSHRSFNYHMCKTRESDIEERGGIISMLSISIQELRQVRNGICQELFGSENTHTLNTVQRLKLARTLKARLNCSLKQIAKTCGLKYDEISELL